MATAMINETEKSTESSCQRSKAIIVLPSYNEELNLPALLANIRQTMADTNTPYHVLVVDDGSKDSTAETARRDLEIMPLTVLVHEQNKGLAGAFRTGLNAAIRLASPQDVIVTLDADNSHNPGMIPEMMRKIREGHDVVIASRFCKGARVFGVPWNRVLLSWGALVLYKCMNPIRNVREYTCAYRAVRADVLTKVMTELGDQFITQEGFASSPEILLKLRKYPLVFGEVPMILRYDQKEGESKMNVMATVFQTLGMLFRKKS